ncbi:MAG: inositol monophosphatase family protein, partial [Acidimicrobiia bacterium]
MRRRRHGLGHRARGATPVVGSPSIDEDLAFALELADAADDITLARYRATDLVVETKPDLTPVTEADQAAEKALRARIEAERPRDGVIGEEYGETAGSAGRRWILDPIDGTFNLVAGHAHWGTHVALEIDGVVAVGVITRPMLGAHWWATLGGGAFADDGTATTRLQVSTRTDVAGAELRLWNSDADHVAAIRAATTWTDADMNDVLGVAEGRCDAVIGCPGEIW